MKYHILTTLIAAALAATSVQANPQFDKQVEWQRQQQQRTDMERQRQQLTRQQREIQQLQEDQRRASKAADRAANAAAYTHARRLLPPVTPAPTPPRFTPAPQDRVHLDRQVRRIQADPNLSPAMKTRLINRILDSVE